MSNALYYLSDTTTRVYIKYHELGKEVEIKLRRLTEPAVRNDLWATSLQVWPSAFGDRIKGGQDWFQNWGQKQEVQETHGFQVLLLRTSFFRSLQTRSSRKTYWVQSELRERFKKRKKIKVEGRIVEGIEGK